MGTAEALGAGRGPGRRSVEHWAALVLGLCGPLALLVLGLFLDPDPRGYGTHERLGLAPCMPMQLWNVPCPGCGITTSLTLAAGGRFGEALATQPFGFLLFCLMLLAGIWAPLTHLRGGDLGRAARSLYLGRAARVLAVLLALGWAYKIWSVRREPAFEHVVFISIDTLRADHLGCYGHELEGAGTISPATISPPTISPRIDALAADGVLFESHISAASTTLASHTSMMTGTHPQTHGVPRNGFVVHEENRLLGEILRAEGFRTAGFVAAAPLSPAFNFQQGFDHYDADFGGSSSGGTEPGDDREVYERRAEEVTDAVLAWLDAVEAGARPLFLFVHYFDPHDPYEAPQPYGGMYREGSGAPDLPDLPRLSRIAGGGADPDEGFLEKVRRRPRVLRFCEEVGLEYCAEVTYTDYHVGRLLDGLAERGILERAHVVLTSDHGEILWEHAAAFSHGRTTFDTEIHVPLILRLPEGREQRRAGTRVAAQTSSVDLLPTILDLLGLAPPRAEGVSLTAAIEGANFERGPVFATATKPRRVEVEGVWPGRDKEQCVRTDRYKLMSRPSDGRTRLHDLERDPDEQRNLLLQGRREIAGVHAELLRSLTEWRARADPLPWRKEGSEEAAAALRALGYAGD